MQPLLAMIKPFTMQHGVDLGYPPRARAISLLPRCAKTVGVIAAAVETGPMPCGERSRFIQEKQLGPASPRHHRATAAAEFAHAGEPGRARPALPEQGPGRGIMDDAAIAGEHATVWCG